MAFDRLDVDGNKVSDYDSGTLALLVVTANIRLLSTYIA
jgi:hypothetical protein